MRRLTDHRATIAGLGSTAALLAAVVAVSVIVGGLVAYTASPAGPLATGDPSLALPVAPDAFGSASRQTVLVLPGASLTGPATAPGTGAGTPARPGAAAPGLIGLGASGGIARDPGGTQPNAGAGTGSTPAVRPVPPPSLSEGLADTTSSAGQNVAGGLGQTLGGIGAAVGGVSPQLGQAVGEAGATLAPAVMQTTETVAGLVRGLGG
ncbi:MAG: hypothetical protein JWN65_3467 [Solirubrobacterales bacterium]|nr:hypothetical protein [Solirubrobacterales bacterium]